MKKQDFYRDFSFDEQVNLINKAIEKATANGYEINIKIWEGYYEREQGLADYFTMEEYLEELIEELKEEGEEINLARELLGAVDFCFGKGGCVEIVASEDDSDYCLYHQERHDEYLHRDLFDLLEIQ